MYIHICVYIYIYTQPKHTYVYIYMYIMTGASRKPGKTGELAMNCGVISQR